jgi:hypothetical protein
MKSLQQQPDPLHLPSNSLMMSRLSVNCRAYLSIRLGKSTLPLRRRFLALLKHFSKSATSTSPEESPIININCQRALGALDYYRRQSSEVKLTFSLQSIVMTSPNSTEISRDYHIRMALFLPQISKSTLRATLGQLLDTRPCFLLSRLLQWSQVC